VISFRDAAQAMLLVP